MVQLANFLKPVMKKKVFSQVWQIAKKIPQGKVATYGQIARSLGLKDARVVGWALHANRDPDLPCHRVVNRQGGLAKGYSFGGWQAQKKRLCLSLPVPLVFCLEV